MRRMILILFSLGLMNLSCATSSEMIKDDAANCEEYNNATFNCLSKPIGRHMDLFCVIANQSTFVYKDTNSVGCLIYGGGSAPKMKCSTDFILTGLKKLGFRGDERFLKDFMEKIIEGIMFCGNVDATYSGDIKIRVKIITNENKISFKNFFSGEKFQMSYVADGSPEIL